MSNLRVGDGDLNLDTGLDGDLSDLLHNLGGGVKIDQALVDAHLVAIPGVGTLSVGGLTRGDAEMLGGEADGAGDLQSLLFGLLDELSAHLFSNN